MTEPSIYFYLAAFFIFAFALGWYSSGAKFRWRQRRLTRSVEELEAQVAALNEKFRADPLRAAIDQGQRYVINQIETLIAQIKDGIAD